MTIRRTAQFTVDPERLGEALDAIEVLLAHTEREPGTLRYESWQSLLQPTQFLHVMDFVDAQAERAHAASDAVRRFTDAVYPLCTQRPTLQAWRPVSVGS